jgi:hypothetical protein
MIRRASNFSKVGLLGLSLVFCGSQKPEPGAAKLWAAITVNHPLYTEGWMNEMVMDFAVFNEGKLPAAVNPCFEHSTLVINGAELTGKDLDWFRFNISNGPRAKDPLPSGRGVYAAKNGNGQLFQKPGVYNVVWKSDCFESSPVVFRVMPREVDE